jgi:branched-chain amino acid transport system substrate-binding protein
MKLKLLALLSVLVLLTTLAAQCAAPPATPAAVTEAPAAVTEAPAAATEAPAAAAEKVFKLGVLGPFTGPSARTGEEFQNAAKMAFEKINYKIGDYKIELVWIDSQSDPEKATRAYEEAIVQGGIQAGIINWHSSVAVAVMEVTAKHKIPHFFGMGATELVNEKFQSDPAKYSYWNFKMWPDPAKLTVNYVSAIESAISQGLWKPEEKRAAIYGEDTDWGRSFGKGLKDGLEKAGWEIVDEQYFPLEQTEFYPLLNKFKDENLALVGGTSTAPPSLSAFIKQADEVGLKSLIIADGLGWVGEWYNLTGNSSNYVLDQIPGWTTDQAKAFAKDFKDQWGIDPSPSAAGISYDSSNFFIKIAEATIKEYGELNSENLHKFAEEKVATGQFTYTDGIVMKEYKYTADTEPDPIVGEGYYTFPVLQYMNGEGKVIWPDAWKVADLQPKP